MQTQISVYLKLKSTERIVQYFCYLKRLWKYLEILISDTPIESAYSKLYIIWRSF